MRILIPADHGVNVGANDSKNFTRNGKTYSLPVGRPFDASSEELEMLDALQVLFARAEAQIEEPMDEPVGMPAEEPMDDGEEN